MVYKRNPLLKNNKRGAGDIWLIALISLLVVGMVYAIFSQVHKKVYDAIVIDGNMSGEYLATEEKIKAVWFVWPIIVIFGIILWAMVQSVRRSESGGGNFG